MLSPSLPNPRLHSAHSQPRNLPVTWQWSKLNSRFCFRPQHSQASGMGLVCAGKFWRFRLYCPAFLGLSFVFFANGTFPIRYVALGCVSFRARNSCKISFLSRRLRFVYCDSFHTHLFYTRSRSIPLSFARSERCGLASTPAVVARNRS